MANINTEIAAFKNAIYGEDVREAMVSLANKINDLATNADFISGVHSSDAKTLGLYTVGNSMNFELHENKYIDINGSSKNSSGRYHSDYISCTPGTTIYYKGESDNPVVNVISFYGKDKSYISNSGISNVGDCDTERSVTVPDEAYYIRISADPRKLSLYDTYVRLEEGSRLFETAIDNLKKLSDGFRNALQTLEYSDSWTVGNLSDSTGNIDTSHTHSNIYTTYLTVPIEIMTVGEDIYVRATKFKNGVILPNQGVSVRTNHMKIDFDSTFDSYRLLVYTKNTSSYSVDQMLSFIKFARSKSNINDIYGDDISIKCFVKANLSTNGSLLGNLVSGNICSVRLTKPVYITLPNTLQYSIGTWTAGTNTFIARSSWTVGTYQKVLLNYDDYQINIATVSQLSDYTLEDIYKQIAYISYYENRPNNNNKIDSTYSNSILTAFTPYKLVHMSYDDVFEIISDLITNGDVYSSIFDNPVLGRMKSIHDATGMTMTLNTFNTVSTDSNYSISNVPEKESFKTEFQANKNWLKFAFHAESDQTNYNSATGAEQSYNTFVTAIYKLTGDYDCIDRFTRLGFFGGTLSNVLTLKNCSYGITGLLASDSTNRVSYYLDYNGNSIVQQHGMYIDDQNIYDRQ